MCQPLSGQEGCPLLSLRVTSPEAMRIAISKIDALIIPGGPASR